MATDTGPGGTIDEFGEVSKRVGRVFRYVLLAATLLGLVALAVLLAYVTNAVRPLTAEPRWYLVFGITLVAPTVAAGWVLRRRNPDALWVGGATLTLPAVGTLFGSGAALLFVDVITPVDWLAHYLAVAIPSVLVLWLDQPGDRMACSLATTRWRVSSGSPMKWKPRASSAMSK